MTKKNRNRNAQITDNKIPEQVRKDVIHDDFITENETEENGRLQENTN
jgi:ribosomal protein S25